MIHPVKLSLPNIVQYISFLQREVQINICDLMFMAKSKQ